MPNITFTVGGKKVSFPGACFDFDLSRINAQNPYGTREAFKEVVRVINDQLPGVIGNVADAVAQGLQAFPGLQGYTGDETWLHLAGHEFEHINKFAGILAAAPASGTSSGQCIAEVNLDPPGHPHTVTRISFPAGDENWIHYNAIGNQYEHMVPWSASADAGSAGTGTAGRFIESLVRDARGHIETAFYGTPTGTVYAGDEQWIHLNAVGNIFEHIGPCAATAESGSTGEFVQSWTRDAKGHIGTATYGTPPTTTYSGDEQWIHLSGTQFQHSAPWSASAESGSPGEFVQSWTRDAMGHIGTASYGTPGSGAAYTGDEQWLHLSGTQFQHSAPWSATAESGSPGEFVQSWTRDTMGHIGTASYGTPPNTTYTGDEQWIHLSGTEFQHIGPYTAAGTVTYSASAGSAIGVLVYDAKGHVVSVTGVALGAWTADEAWIHLSGTQFQHIGPSAAAATYGGNSASYCYAIYVDSKGHVVTGLFTANT